MKGLILKDLYMAAKYCRSYLIITAVFCAVSLFSSENFFFIFYPSVLCGMIPVNLIAYDERSRWSQYCRTMPYKVSQIVGSKYLIGLMAQLAVLVLMCGSQAIKTGIDGSFSLGGFLSLVSVLMCLSMFSSGLCLPFIFRFGVEKGRLAYFAVVGAGCALAVLLSSDMIVDASAKIDMGIFSPVLLLVGAAVYALSWVISVGVYKKRVV